MYTKCLPTSIRKRLRLPIYRGEDTLMDCRGHRLLVTRYHSPPIIFDTILEVYDQSTLQWAWDNNRITHSELLRFACTYGHIYKDCSNGMDRLDLSQCLDLNHLHTIHSYMQHSVNYVRSIIIEQVMDHIRLDVLDSFPKTWFSDKDLEALRHYFPNSRHLV